MMTRMRHTKSGRDYLVLGEAIGQVSVGTESQITKKRQRVVEDDVRLVIYQDDKGQLFWRFPDDFVDRFNNIEQPKPAVQPRNVAGRTLQDWKKFASGTGYFHATRFDVLELVAEIEAQMQEKYAAQCLANDEVWRSHKLREALVQVLGAEHHPTARSAQQIITDALESDSKSSTQKDRMTEFAVELDKLTEQLRIWER